MLVESAVSARRKKQQPPRSSPHNVSTYTRERKDSMPDNMDPLQKAVADLTVDEQTVVIALDASNFAEHAVNCKCF